MCLFRPDPAVLSKWKLSLELTKSFPLYYFDIFFEIEFFWILFENSIAKSLQSCPTLCDPIDGSPPGSPVPGILQARILEWVAISFSNAWKWKVKVKSLNRVRLLATPWTVAYQAPPSMGLSRQEYWSGVPLPSPHILFTGVCCHPLLQGIFPTQGWNLGFLHCRQLLYPLSHHYELNRIMYESGEGNSNPLQYSCLENPMDGGAW